MVHGTMRVWLRLEGLLALALSIALYDQAESSWLLFAVLFLAPDLSFLGYLAGPRIGAILYNLAHSYTLPFALALTAVLADIKEATLYALIWFGHIGLDRALGYGLKYPTAFGDTHLGPIGASRLSASSSPAA